MQTKSDELTALLREIKGERWTRRMRRSDPQHGDLVKRLSASARSVAEAIEELWKLPPNAPGRAHFAETLRIARELSTTLRDDQVEDELDGLLRDSGISEQGQRILARRLGWDGTGGTTLEAAADGAMTRERVRQLEEQLSNAIQRRKPHLRTVEVALDLLAEHAPLSRADAAGLLVAEGFARTHVDPTGLITAAAIAGLATPVEMAGGCVYGDGQRLVAVRVMEAARRVVSRSGAGSVTAVLERIADEEVNAAAVRRIIALDPETKPLDPDQEWFFLPTRENRAANHLRKMLAVSPSLSLLDVREGMRRYRDREVNVPRTVLRELCKCFDWVDVDGDMVRTLVPVDYRVVLENTEETMVDIFREFGPVLDRARTLELGMERGLNRTTTGLYLGWSPIIERVAPNRYALRGADVPPGTLEAMKSSAPRKRVQRGYGWTTHGRLWIGYALSQPVIDSHVVGVPGALKHELRGRYKLAGPDKDLGEITTDGMNLWGLARLLRRYAGEAGDALVLEFDLPSRALYAFIGSQELLDPDNRPDEVIAVECEENDGEEESDEVQQLLPPGGSDADETRELDALRPIRPLLFPDQPTLHPDDIDPANEKPRDGNDNEAGETPAAPYGPGINYREPDERSGVFAGPSNHLIPGNRALPDSPARATKALVLEADENRAVKFDEARAERTDLVNSLFDRLAISASRADEETGWQRQFTETPDADVVDNESLLKDRPGEQEVEGPLRCAVPGCLRPGKHKLGVRCRVWHEPSPVPGKTKTSALWAPDADAFLCDDHALGGARITLIFEPNNSGETAIRVIAAPYARDRTTRIRRGET